MGLLLWTHTAGDFFVDHGHVAITEGDLLARAGDEWFGHLVVGRAVDKVRPVARGFGRGLREFVD